MNDKIVIITGANSGIGKAAALRLATEGYRVIMACRSLERGISAQRQIIEASGNPNVDLLELDVSSFDSIRSFCTAFKAQYPRLDILIHNAAYLNYGEQEYRLSPENVELSFATNAFGPFLLTRLLADHLARSEDPRVLNACTTNIKHFFDPKRQIEFDNLRGEFRGQRRYNVYKMYGDSKMGLLMLTFKLAEELKDRGIQVNALLINRVKLSPETIAKMSPVWRVLARAQNLTNPLPAGMADNYFHLCTSEEYRSVTGRLFNHKREIVEPAANEQGFAQLKNILGSRSYPRYATDPRNVERLWALGTSLAEART